MKVTTQGFAYMMPAKGIRPEQMQTPEGVAHMNFHRMDNMEITGWHLIGPATLTVDVPDLDTLAGKFVIELRATADKLRDESAKVESEIALILNKKQ